MKPYNPALKTFSRNLRSNMTDAEQLLWSRLRRKQILGLQFYRQKPLANYIVDFYCAVVNLVIELDGSQHFEPDHQASDAERSRVLESLGIQVLRFDNRQVLTELDAVMSVIFNTVEKQIPPNPPFTKGGIKATAGAAHIPPIEEEDGFAALTSAPFEEGDGFASPTTPFIEKGTPESPLPPFEKGGQGGFSKKGNSA